MNKKSIIYNHIKNIKKARKNKKIHCSSCIFSMSSDELAYILFIYGFINSCTYNHAIGNLVQKHPIPNQNIGQYFDSLNEKQKNYIITNLQTRYVDCGLGCKQECKIIEVNKI